MWHHDLQLCRLWCQMTSHKKDGRDTLSILIVNSVTSLITMSVAKKVKGKSTAITDKPTRQ